MTSHTLHNLAATQVKIHKNAAGVEAIAWVRGDIPVFDGDEVKIGEPSLNQSNPAPCREPSFEASEYARILHVLGDTRMLTARQLLMEPRTRDELDGEPIDVWFEHVAPLFNEISFKPDAVAVLFGGVSRSDISTIDPSKRPYEREAGVLKKKFAAFKSEYGTCVSRYEASGQGDPDSFPDFASGRSYILYAFCFLKQYPVLEPLAMRALQ